jgi:hypothetical protein
MLFIHSSIYLFHGKHMNINIVYIDTFGLFEGVDTRAIIIQRE